MSPERSACRSNFVMSRSQPSHPNSGISSSSQNSQHGAAPSVCRAQVDVGLLVKPRPLDTPFPLANPSGSSEMIDRVGLERENEREGETLLHKISKDRQKH